MALVAVHFKATVLLLPIHCLFLLPLFVGLFDCTILSVFSDEKDTLRYFNCIPAVMGLLVFCVCGLVVHKCGIPWSNLLSFF